MFAFIWLLIYTLLISCFSFEIPKSEPYQVFDDQVSRAANLTEELETSSYYTEFMSLVMEAVDHPHQVINSLEFYNSKLAPLLTSREAWLQGKRS
jgi:hypothetical protein